MATEICTPNFGDVHPRGIRSIDKRTGGAQTSRVIRRVQSALLLGVFLAVLTASARHDHFEQPDGCQAAACVLCSGAVATAPGAAVLAEAPDLPRETARSTPEDPPLPYLRKLDHSGGAPPRA